MKRAASTLVCLALLASCTSSTPTDEEQAASLLNALAESEWSQDAPYGLPPFVISDIGEADIPGAVAAVGASSVIETEATSGGVVNIAYVVFPSYDEASAAVDDYVRVMADTGEHRSNVGQSRLCVFDAASQDECAAVAGNAMVRILSRLRLSGLSDEAHTEELMELALAHLRAVKTDAGL